MTMFQWKASDFVLVGKKLKFYLFGKTFVADFVFNVFMTNVPNLMSLCRQPQTMLLKLAFFTISI